MRVSRCICVTCVAVPWDKSRSYPLNLVGTGLSTRQHSALDWFNGNQLEARFERLQELEDITYCRHTEDIR
jgi:hypothetical protein